MRFSPARQYPARHVLSPVARVLPSPEIIGISNSQECVIDARKSLAYHGWHVIFIESAVFTNQVRELLSDESYADFQWYLTQCPEAGDLIKDTGGLRKVRWAMPGRGKRGGVRVIYYHVSAQKQVRLLLIYRKGLKDDLTAEEKRVLRKINQDW